MAENIEKLEAKIKALQAKKREATKQAKAKQQKAEFERLKEVEKEFENYVKKGEGKYAKQGKELNDLLVKYGVKTFKEGFDILEKELVSMKSQQQNN